MTKKTGPNQKAFSRSIVPRRRRRWFRFLLRWGIRLAMVGVVVFVLLRQVVAPMFWRWATREFLDDYWVGSVRIGTVDFSFKTGTAMLHNVSLRDGAGREWVHIDSVTYTLRDWPSLRPILHEIRIDEPAATVYLDDGLANIPLKGSTVDEMLEDSLPETSSAPPPGPFDKKYYIDIEKTYLNDISLMVVESDSHFLRDLRDKIPPTQSRLLRNLRFYGTASAAGDISLTHGGRVDASARAEFRVKLSKLVVHDLRQLLGRAPLEGGVKTKPLVIKDVRVPKITYHNGKLAVPKFFMKLGRGHLQGHMQMHIEEDKPIAFSGDVQAYRIPLRTFYDAYDPTQEVMYGYATAMIDDITGTTRDLRDLDMDGAVAMDDSDLDQVHVIEDVFNKMRVNPLNIRHGSDLRVVFELHDGVMTLAQARLGNNLVAVMAEPHGTVDIVGHQMNFRILGATLNDLGKIPILGWVANLTNQLTALRVTGDWSRPKIRVEPIRNVTSGMASFFRDAARAGGELTGLNAEK
jgi:hypothetical protein